jgi:predicted acyl esterase
LDQAPLETRPDVITFSTPVLTEPLAITGGISVRCCSFSLAIFFNFSSFGLAEQVTLYVSSNCTDTDFTAKLTDVYPTGESRILNDGIVRMRWRNLAVSNDPQLMIPGEVYEITISMWNTSYIVGSGWSDCSVMSSTH